MPDDFDTITNHSGGRKLDYRNLPPSLRARGNLSYLQFIELVKQLWARAHPDIPLVISGNPEVAKYPVIVYSLQLRKTHPGEPKMRLREERDEQQNAYLVGGQRFQNIVYFQAVAETRTAGNGARIAEQIIELFEDFMMEFTPVFKQLGISELVYARRLSDTDEQRPGENIVKRTVSYMVTTEKVVAKRYDKLEQALVSVRTWLEDYEPYEGAGTIYNDSPRFSLVGADAVLAFLLRMTGPVQASENDDPVFDNTQVESFEELVFVIPGTNFRINDTLYLSPNEGNSVRGFFKVTSLVGNPYSPIVGYTLQKRDSDNPDINGWTEDVIGSVFYIPDRVLMNIDDEHKS